jgi:protein-S-isoprenylcysteine O-methyltransferase Ste14
VQDPPVPPARLPLHLNRLVQHLSRDAFGGPRVLKLAWVINFQKAGTAPLLALMMWYYGNVAPAAWVYLGLHGSYGLCWLIKDLAVPDRGFQARVTFGGALLSFLLVLGPYWVIAWLMVSDVLGPGHPQPGPALMAACVGLHTIGVALMVGADAQKNAALKLRPGLIVDGLYARVRHPNYLGEMMIYAAYAVMVRHWLAWAILLPIWLLVFLPNMAAQEASLSRHQGWAAYKARTGFLWPRLVVRRDDSAD